MPALGPLLVAAFIIALSAPARAESESARLFEEGRGFAKEQKWQEACSKFAESLELDRAPGTLLNFGDCHEHLGHFAEAWRSFDEAGRAFEAANEPERAKYARERAQAALPKTSAVILKLAAPDTTGLKVEIVGRKIAPAAMIREVVDPGDVAIEVSAPDMQPFTKKTRAEAGVDTTILVPNLVAAERRVRKPDPDPDLDLEPETRRRRSYALTAYTLAAIGGASLAAGVAMGVSADFKYEAQYEGNPPPCRREAGVSLCTREGYNAQRSAITRSKIGTTMGIGGLVLISGASALFFMAPKDVVVLPTASASSAGLAVVGRF